MKCFRPVLDKDTEIVFLGSFPGLESLKKKQYYGHPQNQFWKLVGKIIDKDLHSMKYDDKLKTLRKHRVGLWDVIHRCDREGSLDTNIKNKEMNDLKKINQLAPNLKLACFNGKTSGKVFDDIVAPKKVILPSSSPANTMDFERKLREWKRAIRAHKM